MTALFVDTGGWYAAMVPTDRWHRPAAGVLEQAIGRKIPLVTSNLVVGETYTLLVTTRGHAAAWNFVDRLKASPRLEVATIDPSIEKDAWTLLRRFGDQAFSFVDGTSFALMKKRRMTHAFALDRHFGATGFVRVPVDEPLPVPRSG